ncbi:MAG TPA: hypothetical protein DCY57_06065 [Bacteroidetes bacterium]|nr:hypothetical protein [Bacteroidota bacterium]
MNGLNLRLLIIRQFNLTDSTTVRILTRLALAHTVSVWSALTRSSLLSARTHSRSLPAIVGLLQSLE